MKTVFIINDTAPEHHHGCSVVMTNISRALEKRNLRVVGRCPVGQDWQRPHYLKKMHEADLVIVNGEGSIHHNRPYAQRLLEAGIYCQRRRQTVVCINTVWQANDQLTSLVDHFDAFYVRDSFSQQELATAGKNVDWCPDMTFYDQKPNKTSPSKKRICVTDSVDEQLSRQLYHLSRKQEYDYLPITQRLTRSNINTRSLLKQVKMALYPWLTKNDWLAGRLRHSYLRQRFSISTPSQYIDQLSENSLAVCARFHALCFCIQTETPFVALASNSHKVAALLHDSQLASKRLLPEIPSELNADEWQFSAAELSSLREFNHLAVKRIDAMFDRITSL